MEQNIDGNLLSMIRDSRRSIRTLLLLILLHIPPVEDLGLDPWMKSLEDRLSTLFILLPMEVTDRNQPSKPQDKPLPVDSCLMLLIQSKLSRREVVKFTTVCLRIWSIKKSRILKLFTKGTFKTRGDLKANRGADH